MKTPPDVIWLQWYEDDGFEESDDDELIPHLVDSEEVTWCEDKINDSDVEYVKVKDRCNWNHEQFSAPPQLYDYCPMCGKMIGI